MARRTLLTDPHIYRPGGHRDDGGETCRDCHQSFTTSWLHTDQALKLMDRVRRAETDRGHLADQVQRVRALHTRVDHPRAVVCSTCLDADEEPAAWPCPTIAALDGTEPGT